LGEFPVVGVGTCDLAVTGDVALMRILDVVTVAVGEIFPVKVVSLREDDVEDDVANMFLSKGT
jgi:hypothetical protein